MAAVEKAAIASSEDQFSRHHSPAQPAEMKYERDVRDLVDLLSRLNPSAKEFFPSSRKAGGDQKCDGRLSVEAPIFVVPSYCRKNGKICNDGSNDSASDGSSNTQPNRKKRNGWRRMNSRVRKAQSEESIRRTVYISDIDQQVTEEKLADVFARCGQVVDCRVCGDPNSILRFAFIEFADEAGAKAALKLEGTMLGFYPVRVLPSKTAILPVNPKFLPKSENEKEMVVRTVYCTNIDKKVTQIEVKVFFEQSCGEVSRLRILGDSMHSTRIAFVEFLQAESAILALNCTGMILGTLPMRVSPSKTPVRLRAPRTTSK